MDDPVIRTMNLSYQPGGSIILENINMAVQPGEFIGIIGPNGAGKTTLLRLLLGLIRPTGGEVAVLGMP
ncbi:MAG TPA: ATP-binding cassette domain-containing protein, partial [Bacillota bacterium]|nr:ATP-binding cassette domain-containing protein [Bacillota bacterium]